MQDYSKLHLYTCCVQESRFKERLQHRAEGHERDPLLPDTAPSDNSEVCEHI